MQERNSQETPSRFPLPLEGQTSTEVVAMGVEEEAVVVEEVCATAKHWETVCLSNWTLCNPQGRRNPLGRFMNTTV